jgi:NitT/TauT family transport system ATP-binding protein
MHGTPLMGANPEGPHLTSRPNVIEARGVSHSYEALRGWVHALEEFEITIPKNEFLCILGPSGCGKSTFLRILAGLMVPQKGTVLLNGHPITGPGLDRGIVFQEPAIFPWLTVDQNVAFGLHMSGWSKTAIRERTNQVLEIVRLGNYKDLYPYQLSGGMRHRVAVARAWALTDAAVLLMDEPFSAIDAINRAKLQDYLVETWLAEARTVVYVTHDIEEAVYLADRVAILTPSPGRVVKCMTIDLPRPRSRNSTAVSNLKVDITAAMSEASMSAPGVR